MKLKMNRAFPIPRHSTVFFLSFLSWGLFSFPITLGAQEQEVEKETPKQIEIVTLKKNLNCPKGDFSWVREGEEVALKIGGQDQGISLKDVVRIEMAQANPLLDLDKVLLVLRSGERLYVNLDDGTEEFVKFKTQNFVSKNEVQQISLENIKALLVPKSFESRKTFNKFQAKFSQGTQSPIKVRQSQWNKKSKETADPEAKETEALEDDRLLTSEGTSILGLLLKVDSKGFLFENDELGEVQLSKTKIRAVEIADEEEPGSGNSTRLRVLVLMKDHSRFLGLPTSLKDGRLDFKSRGLGSIAIDLDEVQSIEILGGNATYLSDLSPTESVSKDPFSARDVQRDRNVRGGPLKIRDKEYRKGLGMRSHTSLSFKIGSGFKRFQAILGIDDEARQSSLESRRQGGGTAIFKVYLDGQVSFQRQLSFVDPAERLDLPVEGVQVLRIEVDYGPGLWIQDYANWADARLIRS